MANPDWGGFCRTKAFTLEAGAVVVRLSAGRHHRVAVKDVGATYEMESIVAPASLVRALGDVPLRAWLRNRSSQLVGFRVDHRGRLIGEAWVPKMGLAPEEFQLYVLRVATECDRFEYLLTGSDSG